MENSPYGRPLSGYAIFSMFNTTRATGTTMLVRKALHSLSDRQKQ